jgi:hypothetical protein
LLNLLRGLIGRKIEFGQVRISIVNEKES